MFYVDKFGRRAFFLEAGAEMFLCMVSTTIKNTIVYQSLVGSMVNGVGLYRENHGSIPAIAIGRGLEPLDAKTGSRTRLGSPVGRVLVVEKNDYNYNGLKFFF
jgi:hypothetical protein